MNRLKTIREDTLKLTLEAFATAVGEKAPDPEKWYLQRVGRIENGTTRLNETMIADICRAFPQIEPWHFFADPEEVYPQAHREIVGAYLKLSRAEQTLLDKILFPDRTGGLAGDPDKAVPKGVEDDATGTDTPKLTAQDVEAIRARLKDGQL